MPHFTDYEVLQRCNQKRTEPFSGSLRVREQVLFEDLLCHKALKHVIGAIRMNTLLINQMDFDCWQVLLGEIGDDLTLNRGGLISGVPASDKMPPYPISRVSA